MNTLSDAEAGRPKSLPCEPRKLVRLRFVTLQVPDRIHFAESLPHNFFLAFVFRLKGASL